MAHTSGVSYIPFTLGIMTTDVLSANYVALGAASLITGLLVKRWLTRKDLPHPPGPAGLPLIGST